MRDCYAALGVVHSKWTPIPGRFKDYIALPKPNMYQSLHTTVIGPRARAHRGPDPHAGDAPRRRAGHRRALEVQGEQRRRRRRRGRARRSRWLRQLMEWQQDLKDPTEFLETREGRPLPATRSTSSRRRATSRRCPRARRPIDFAYAIHSEVGEHCSGARVNGMIVPLRYKLRNGDTVEIITVAEPEADQGLAQVRRHDAARAAEDPQLPPAGAARAQPAARHASCSSASCASTTRRSPARGEAGLARRGGRASCALGTVDELLVRSATARSAAQQVRRDGAARAISAAGRRRAAPTAETDARDAARARSRAAAIDRAASRSPARTTSWCGSPSAARRCRAIRSSASSRRGRGVTVHTPRLRQGARPRSRAPRRRRVGRRIARRSAGRDPGPLRRQARACSPHISQSFTEHGRQHLAGQLPHHRGRPRREHLPGHGRPPRSAQDRAAEPGLTIIEGVVDRHPAVIEGRAMASNTRITWKRRARKHVNMGKKRKAKESQASTPPRREAVRRPRRARQAQDRSRRRSSSPCGRPADERRPTEAVRPSGRATSRSGRDAPSGERRSTGIKRGGKRAAGIDLPTQLCGNMAP